MLPSSFNRWPTREEPDNRYKISSVVITLDQNIYKIERSTYSSLEWLGDIGGLYDAMRLIGQLIVSPVALFSLKAELISQAFGSRLASHNQAVKKCDIGHDLTNS